MGVRRLPSIYQAEAVVLIDSQKIPDKFVTATVASDSEERIAAIRQMLLSSGELKKVIEDFGLYREERKSHFEEDILEMMRSDISITLDSGGPDGGSRTAKTRRAGAFRVGYQGSDPVMVTRVANRLADLYVEQNLKTREGQAAGTSDFLDTQLRDAKKHLDEMEAQVSAYKLQHNGELPQQENVLAGALGRLQTELEANRDAINRAHQNRVILESSINAMEATLTAQILAWQQAQQQEDQPVLTVGPVTPKSKLPDIEAAYTQLRAKYGDNHPDVVSLRSELENARGSSRQGPPGSSASRSVTPALAEPPEIGRTRQQLDGLKAQLKGSDTELANRNAEQQRILRDLGSYQKRIERLPIREQELAQMTRDYEVSKENYKSLLDKKMAAGMSLDMERRQQSERFIVLDRAQVPERPFKPKRPQLYAAGAVAALALAILFAFVAELRENVLLGEWELPAGTPVLARLPYIEVAIGSAPIKRNRRGWLARKKQLASATVASILFAKIAMAAHSLLGRL
jgi:polysaccharide chain length determinant protein (PEP-CTERM system associated)